MINLYDWSFQIENNLVRLEYSMQLKKYLESCIKQFGGILMPVKSAENDLIIKFKSSKVANDFILAMQKKYPNSFHLINNWDIGKSSKNALSFSSITKITNSFSELSDLISSLFVDFKVICSLTNKKPLDIQMNVDMTICYFTFSIDFSNNNECEDFLKDFNHFKK